MKKLLLFLTIFSALSCGCGKAEKKPSQHLRICMTDELSYADPQKVYNDAHYKIMQAVFEGLVVPDPETMTPLPGVAERWTVSPDGRVYEFFLRDNAFWSNGEQVTAEDFVYSAKRALSSKFMCPFSELFFPLQNAEQFFDRKIRDFSKVGITAVNPRTLKITLEKNTPHFLSILMHPCWSPLRDSVIKSFAQYNKNASSSSAFKAKVISNGPFVFSEKIPGIYLMLEKNDNYWDADNVLLESVTFFTEKNQVSIEKNFSERAIDIAEIYKDDESTLGDCSSNNELVVSQAFECFGLAFNTENETFKNRNVRLALSLAIDREKLLDAIEKNRSLVAHSIIPVYNEEYKNEKLFDRDPELAKKLLAEAGYNESHKLPVVRILCNTSESKFNTAALKQIQNDWKNILDVDSQIEHKDLNLFFKSRKKLNFDLAKTKYSDSYCDPLTIASMFTSKHPKNYGKWKDQKYDKMIEAAATTTNIDEQNELIKDAEQYLAQEMPAIPLFFKSNSYLVRKRICGWFPNAMNFHPLKFVYFSQ